MKKIGLFWKILIVILLCFSGIFILIMSLNNWDFNKVINNSYIETEEVIDGEFDNININLDALDLTFVKSNNEENKVNLIAHEKVKSEINVESNTLYINIKDEREWFDRIGIFNEMEMIIYLNESTYDELIIIGSTGDIEIPKDFSFLNSNIELTTGDIDFSSNVNNLNIELTTGDVDISSISCLEDINIMLTTGELELDNVTCRNFMSKGSTGKIELNNLIAIGKISIEMTTGDIEFNRCDASEIFVKTTTGDVKGSLMSNKHFITHTTTGNVKVPSGSEGGKCEIYCTTGNINIWIED